MIFNNTINLQSKVLPWLIDGENEEFAYRELTSETAGANKSIKKTYKGKIDDYINNYLNVYRGNHFESVTETNDYTAFTMLGSSVINTNIEYIGTDLTMKGDSVLEISLNFSEANISNVSPTEDYFRFTLSATEEIPSGGITSGIQIININTEYVSVRYRGDGSIHNIPVNLLDDKDHKFKFKTSFPSDTTVTYSISIDDLDYIELGTVNKTQTNWKDILDTITSAYSMIYVGTISDSNLNIAYVKQTIDGTVLDYTFTDLTTEGPVVNGDFTSNVNKKIDVTYHSIDITYDEFTSGIDLFPNREPINMRINRYRILRDLNVYKNTWNKDSFNSTKVLIDNIYYEDEDIVFNLIDYNGAVSAEPGYFNGIDSVMSFTVPTGTLANSEPITVEFEFKTYDQMLDEQRLFSVDRGWYGVNINNDISQPIDTYTYIGDGGSNFKQNIVSNYNDDTWHKFEFTIPCKATDNSTFKIDDQVPTNFNSVVGEDYPTWDDGLTPNFLIDFGKYATESNNPFKGGIKNIKITNNGVTLIDCIDIPNGINNGTLGDSANTNVSATPY